MTRPLTPIERMVDAACGFDREAEAKKPKITLRCPAPGCTETRLCDRTEIDPPNAVTQEFPCPKHRDPNPNSYDADVHYFDANGTEIPFP